MGGELTAFTQEEGEAEGMSETKEAGMWSEWGRTSNELVTRSCPMTLCRAEFGPEDSACRLCGTSLEGFFDMMEDQTARQDMQWQPHDEVFSKVFKQCQVLQSCNDDMATNLMSATAKAKSACREEPRAETLVKHRLVVCDSGYNSEESSDLDHVNQD